MADLARPGAPRSPLADLLSLLRPTPADTTFLRACLLSGRDGSAALERWSSSGSAADLLPSRLNRLFPLLAGATRHSDLPLPPGVRSILRAAMASEELRYEAYLGVIGPALAGLAEAAVDAIVLKGAALAETVYPQPQLRHCHDIDLLVSVQQRAAAVAHLQQRGWQRRPDPHDAATDAFVHSSGLPLSLHTGASRCSLVACDFGALMPRARAVSIAGVPALTLSPADALLHTLAQSIRAPAVDSLQWACDAAFLIDRIENRDWDAFLDQLTQTGLALAFGVLIRSLRDDLDRAVPDAVVDEIDRQAASAAWQQREAAVATLDVGGFGRRRMWTCARTWSTRVALLKWWLWPRSDLARALHPGLPPWRLPLRNVRRALATGRAPGKSVSSPSQ